MLCKQPVIACCFYLALCLTSSNSFAQNGTSNKLTDAAGIKRDLLYLMGYQAISVGFMYYMPESITGWSDNEKDELGVKQWKRHIQNPHWDKDHWVMNYVLHPYWGGAYYIRGRERGFSKTESFWISVLFSTVYEFAVESFMEEPSIQDLFVTPIAGTAVGMYFEEVRYRIKNKGVPLSQKDKIILVLTDPLGAINRQANSWLGIHNEEQARAQLGMSLIRSGSSEDQHNCRTQQTECDQAINGVGINFNYTW
jgi:hypothetical protein